MFRAVVCAVHIILILADLWGDGYLAERDTVVKMLGSGGRRLGFHSPAWNHCALPSSQLTLPKVAIQVTALVSFLLL